MSHDDEERETHESYGLVSFCRVSGNPGTLFGSPLTNHESFISLRIAKGERINSFGHDRFYGSTRGDIVEVDMSAAQFAELLTTMNVGLGVPCTIRRIENRQMAKPPVSEMEVEKVRSTFKRYAKEAAAAIEEDRKKVEELLAKKTLSKEDRKEILWVIGRVQQHLASTAPLMLDQFQEATEKVVTHAKAEVDAFMTHNIIAEGIRAITEKNQKAQLTTQVACAYCGKDSDHTTTDGVALCGNVRCGNTYRDGYGLSKNGTAKSDGPK